MNKRTEEQMRKDAKFAAAALKVLMGFILALAVIVAMVYSWDSIIDEFLDGVVTQQVECKNDR